MRTILHADMDAFYAAVEQRDHPELRGKPVIVSGNSPRSVVTTASYEARVFGVRSAMPALQARQLCPQGVFVRPRMPRYVEVGRQIRRIFEEFTPLVEPLSLDEAFLDVTASLKLFGGVEAIARGVRQRVREETQLAVSVGGGATKMVAKIASGLCKPDGMLIVPPQDVARFLDPLDVGQLWGVGEKTRSMLHAMGLRSVGSLARSSPALLESRLGSMGRDLWALANGEDVRTVVADRQRKSIGEEQTFERDLRDGEEIRRILASQAESVAAHLRRQGFEARTVTLKMKLATRLAPGKYPLMTRRITLEEPTSDGRIVREAVLKLWATAERGALVRLVGVSLSGIQLPTSQQLSLFGQKPAAASLNRAVDAINDRFGKSTIRRGDSVAGRKP